MEGPNGLLPTFFRALGECPSPPMAATANRLSFLSRAQEVITFPPYLVSFDVAILFPGISFSLAFASSGTLGHQSPSCLCWASPEFF